ncbi:hypothetical protein HDU96_004895, partial [Phlyctochytrium bullatum]
MVQHFRTHAQRLGIPVEAIDRGARALKTCAPGSIPAAATNAGLMAGYGGVLVPAPSQGQVPVQVQYGQQGYPAPVYAPQQGPYSPQGQQGYYPPQQHPPR